MDIQKETQKDSPGQDDDTRRYDQPKEVKSSDTIKDPDDQTAGSEPMSGAQMAYLKTLSDEAGETSAENLTRVEASEKISELQQKTGSEDNKQERS